MRGVWVRRWLAEGAIRNYGPALLCRQDYFPSVVWVCAHWPALLFVRTFAFTLAPLAARSGGTPCSTPSFCLVEVFESRKLVFGCRKWRVFRFWGRFWGVLGDFQAQNRYFCSFFAVTPLLRAGVEVLGITSHLLNGSGHRRRLVRRTVQRLVQLFHFVRSRCLSPENWYLGVENGVFFGFGDDFGVFWVIFRRKTSTFSSFFSVA